MTSEINKFPLNASLTQSKVKKAFWVYAKFNAPNNFCGPLHSKKITLNSQELQLVKSKCRCFGPNVVKGSLKSSVDILVC